MGLNASSQFLGAFAGGVLGGQLLAAHAPIQLSWAVLTVLGLLWLWVAQGLRSPPYLSSLAVRLPAGTESITTQEQALMQRLLAVRGVEDVVILLEQQIAYLKIDKRVLGEDERHQLSQILEYPVVF